MLISTTWTVATRPTNTSYTARIKPGDFSYYTWDTSTMIWDSATFTWDTAGIGMPATTWITTR